MSDGGGVDEASECVRKEKRGKAWQGEGRDGVEGGRYPEEEDNLSTRSGTV